MSNLSAFLHPVKVQEEKDIVISDRFVDENGKPLPFRVRSMTQEENEALRKKSTHAKKINGQRVEQVDSAEYSRRLIVAATVSPDFSSKEMCDGYGVLDPLLVPSKMLFSGEFAKLQSAILEISGFEDTPEGDETLDSEVKN